MEMTNVFTCRICLEDELNENNLIVPCKCSGSSKHVHRTCLDLWRRENVERNSHKCNTCNFLYIMEENNNQLTDSETIYLRELSFTKKCIIFTFIFIILSFTFILFCLTCNSYINSLYIFILGLTLPIMIIGYCFLQADFSIFFLAITFPKVFLFISFVLGLIAIPKEYKYIVRHFSDQHRRRLQIANEVTNMRVRDFKGRENEIH